jgi:hypothetical protein
MGQEKKVISEVKIELDVALVNVQVPSIEDYLSSHRKS